MDNTAPNFVINTRITEQQYRKGLRATFKKRILAFWIFYSAFLFIVTFYDINKIYYCIQYDYDIPILTVITALCFLVFAVWGAVNVIRLPNRSTQNAIDALVNETGSTEINAELSFYGDKIQVKLRGRERIGYLVYRDVCKILVYNDFWVFVSMRNTAVYIAKSDVDNQSSFVSYMSGKCPSAKVIEKS